MLSTRLLAYFLLAVSFLSLIPQPPATHASQLKIVSLYESIIDTNISTLTSILEETHTDIIFRAYFRGYHRNLDPRDYSKLAGTIRAIKTKLPWVQVMGGISCSAIYYPGDYWPNLTRISAETARQMLWVLPNGSLGHHSSFPWPILDLSKPLTRQFIEAYAYRFIDAGIDSLFFDEVDLILNIAPRYGLNVTRQPYLEAWTEIVHAVKDYARRSRGRDVLVTLNSGYVNSIGEPSAEIWPGQDFITVSFNPNTIKSQSNQDDWQGFKRQIEKTYGHLMPIMAFIDWGVGETPLSIFASLSGSKQIALLKLLHDVSAREGLLFVYPLRGGTISGSAVNYQNTYDARKQGTLSTIVQLTANADANHTPTSASWLPGYPTADDNVYSTAGIITAAALIFGMIVLKRRNSRLKST